MSQNSLLFKGEYIIKEYNTIIVTNYRTISEADNMSIPHDVLSDTRIYKIGNKNFLTVAAITVFLTLYYVINSREYSESILFTSFVITILCIVFYLLSKKTMLAITANSSNSIVYSLSENEYNNALSTINTIHQAKYNTIIHRSVSDNHAINNFIDDENHYDNSESNNSALVCKKCRKPYEQNFDGEYCDECGEKIK